MRATPSSSLEADAADARRWLHDNHPELRVMSAGEVIEIYKEMGLPSQFVSRFALAELQGTHALGHTRMATESRVTTIHSHPFSTGLDLCLVHNGSLSNHNRLRIELRRAGIEFATDNDSEVAAGFLTWRLAQGESIEEALEGCIGALDGFYTFAVGTRDGFAVLRDPIALQAGGPRRDRRLGRDGLRVPRDRGAPRLGRRGRLGARPRRGLQLAPGARRAPCRAQAMTTVASGVETVDLDQVELRELNRRLHESEPA